MLLADWAAARPPVYFLAVLRPAYADRPGSSRFIEAPRVIDRICADAADLLAMDKRMSADVTASVANDAAKLPPGAVIIVTTSILRPPRRLRT